MEGFGNGNSTGANSQWPKILGQAIFYSSIQAAIGSVEMSSKFSVINFATNEDTLVNAVRALKAYLIIGTAWMAGTMLVMYSQYGYKGLIAGFVTNMIYILWIYISYYFAFKEASEKNGLNAPNILLQFK